MVMARIIVAYWCLIMALFAFIAMFVTHLRSNDSWDRAHQFEVTALLWSILAALLFR
jgi:NADH:ubiquinone oxidoreductase subunit 6 (subunit J)